MRILKSIKEKIRIYRCIHKDPTRITYYRSLGVKIGKNCSFVGDNIGFSSEPYLITIGNNVRVSFDVCFFTHDGGTHVLRNNYKNICIYGPIVVGDNCFIGARSLIMPNVTIGDNCIIGAGSIITKDVPNNSVVAGVPARYICSVDEYKEKNENKFSYILDMTNDDKKEYLLNLYK